MRMLWHALAYAKRRWWAVFPCVPGGKIPLTSHGFKDASCSKEVITDWWLRWPNANIGLVIPDNHIILDIDPRNGGSINNDELPSTRTVRTPAGGLHLYYWTLTDDTAYTKQWRPGIDVKAPGKGYVLLPPSRTTMGHYEWVNRETMALLPPCIHDEIRKNNWHPITTTSTSNPSAALSWSLQELAMAREGSRNDTLFRVTTFLVRVIAAEEFSSALKKIEAMALSRGLDGFEVYRTMRSAYEAAGGEPHGNAVGVSTPSPPPSRSMWEGGDSQEEGRSSVSPGPPVPPPASSLEKK